MKCCNKCGKTFKQENKIIQEDYVKIYKEWGYFSKKDGQTCELIICESCMDQLLEDLVIPADICLRTELI